MSVLQYAEGLTDRQAADQVRARMDWKFLLGLELDGPGFGFPMLSDFHSRLIGHGLEEKVLDLDLVSNSGHLRCTPGGVVNRWHAPGVLRCALSWRLRGRNHGRCLFRPKPLAL
ncbi:transposase [Streptomyces sp. NPDC096030]|uniref:transposase n=1 Tax=Streptomyces sp. NPDC096030 TaxID=3155423 RepID=UPI00331D7A82